MGSPYSQAALATPGQRIGARLIDALISGVVVVLLIARSLIRAFDDGDVSPLRSPWLLVAGVAFGIVYEVATVAIYGGTPGKLILGLRVVNRSDGSSPIGWSAALMRWLPSMAGNIPVIGGLLGLAVFIASVVWLFSDPNRQTVYDRAAGTLVVDAKSARAGTATAPWDV